MMKDTTSVAAEKRPETVTELVGVTDQLAAAVRDIWGAWAEFRFGPPTGAEGATPQSKEVEADRLMRIGAGIHEQVAALRDLAQHIRQRA